MPQVSVSERTGRKLEGVLRIGEDGEIKLTYYPDRISARILKNIVRMGRLMNAPSTEENTLAIMDACDDAAQFVVKIVDTWDLLLTREPRVVAPLTVDAVADFGVEFLFEVMTGLVELVNMGEAKGTPSSTASLRTPSNRSRRSSRR